MKLAKNLLTLTCLLTSSQTFANSTSSRPDYHAPIGVMRDHAHDKGEFMMSYRIAYMKMKGIKSGTNRLTTDESLKTYMMAPTEMTMRAEMIGAMYGINNKLTLAAMVGSVHKTMNMLNRSGGKIKRESDGITDSKINALYKIYAKNDTNLQLNFGVSLPTGSISKDNPSSNQRQNYPMQIGSGSYELLPGISYSKFNDSFSYGAQVNASFKMNSNNYNYKLGDSYNATMWLAEKLNDSFSISTRLDYMKSEAIEGLDSTLKPAMMAAADGSIQDGEKLDLAVGTNYIVSNGYFKGHRLALEISRPIYQKTGGHLLENGYKAVAGWQKTF